TPRQDGRPLRATTPTAPRHFWRQVDTDRQSVHLRILLQKNLPSCWQITATSYKSGWQRDRVERTTPQVPSTQGIHMNDFAQLPEGRSHPMFPLALVQPEEKVP